jgi:hypothetical protein
VEEDGVIVHYDCLSLSFVASSTFDFGLLFSLGGIKAT